jgi:hypothetical protein
MYIYKGLEIIPIALPLRTYDPLSRIEGLSQIGNFWFYGNFAGQWLFFSNQNPTK